MKIAKKRGRPTVTEKLYGDNKSQIETIITVGKSHCSSRTVADSAYMFVALRLFKEAASEIPNQEVIYRPDYVCRSILCQLGRMIGQNDYSIKSFIEMANVAIKAKQDGCTAKQIERYIRQVRKSGQW